MYQNSLNIGPPQSSADAVPADRETMTPISATNPHNPRPPPRDFLPNKHPDPHTTPSSGLAAIIITPIAVTIGYYVSNGHF